MSKLSGKDIITGGDSGFTLLLSIHANYKGSDSFSNGNTGSFTDFLPDELQGQDVFLWNHDSYAIFGTTLLSLAFFTA
ncbi:MAG: hypothetical protein ACTSUE_03830 [Promethearchaeota archaeon]